MERSGIQGGDPCKLRIFVIFPSKNSTEKFPVSFISLMREIFIYFPELSSSYSAKNFSHIQICVACEYISSLKLLSYE